MAALVPAGVQCDGPAAKEDKMNLSKTLGAAMIPPVMAAPLRTFWINSFLVRAGSHEVPSALKLFSVIAYFLVVVKRVVAKIQFNCIGQTERIQVMTS